MGITQISVDGELYECSEPRQVNTESSIHQIPGADYSERDTRPGSRNRRSHLRMYIEHHFLHYQKERAVDRVLYRTFRDMQLAREGLRVNEQHSLLIFIITSRQYRHRKKT
ncbi:hypothetical protein PM082_000649 [Marasmius tenuissimus]|nr:hypothetical protein PM082_000649 [Marasmius tenuissimus]